MKSKIIIVGNSGTGKTSIRERYIKGAFRAEQLLTIGVEYDSTHEEVNGNQSIKLDIYDIAGQDTFQVQKKVMNNIHGAIVVFDITRHETFFSLRNWLDKIYQYNPKSKAPIIIVGNKTDLGKRREIPSDEVEKFIQQLQTERDVSAKYLEFIETSAKTGKNINHVFSTLAKYILICFH